MKKILILFIGLVLINCAGREEVGLISTKYGDIIIEFYADVAPLHVESFKILANEEYFNGTTFHRVIPGFVIQGGDPKSKDDDRANDGMGGRAGKFYGVGEENDPDTWLLPAEFNDLPHKRGALSMARSRAPNSAGSQFFICVANAFRLDNKYTVFGQVIKGMEIVDQIVNLPLDGKDNPLESVEMSVRILPRSQVLK